MTISSVRTFCAAIAGILGFGRPTLPRVVAVLLALALLGPAGRANATPSGSLRDPRPQSWVLDTTGTLRPEARARLETVAESVRASGRGEIVVVVTDSVDGDVPRTYATRVFNAWRIGSAAKDDGVLVFAALSDRKSEIVLGDGLSSPSLVKASERVMQTAMLPHFKDQDPNGALVAGAEGCAADILGVTVPGGMPLSASGAAADATDGWDGEEVIAGTAGGGGLLFGLVLLGRAAARRRPRRCPRCAKPMVKLGEAEDDAHLSQGEQVEERVGSVDYDVWVCSCGAAEKLRYGALFTRYARCGRCSARTTAKTTSTLQHATEHSEGLSQVEERCAHCGHWHSYTRTIPRVTRHDSSSGGSFGGGGSSSGAGASGSW